MSSKGRSKEATVRRREKELARLDRVNEKAAKRVAKQLRYEANKAARPKQISSGQIRGDILAAKKIPGTYQKLSHGDTSGVSWEKLRK